MDKDKKNKVADGKILTTKKGSRDICGFKCELNCMDEYEINPMDTSEGNLENNQWARDIFKLTVTERKVDDNQWDTGIDDLITQMENYLDDYYNRHPNEATNYDKEVITVQYYLKILENYIDYHEKESQKYEIGQYFGFRDSGIDGRCGKNTLKALYNFQQSHSNVEKTIARNEDGTFSGVYDTNTIDGLKKEVIAINVRWKEEFESSTSTLNKVGYPTANPYYYIEFIRQEGDKENFDEIDPVFKGRLAALAKDNKEYLRFSEGLRDYERQKYLKNKYGRKAADPGFSRHNWGVAVDTNSLWLKGLCGEATEHYNDQTELTYYGVYKPLTSGNGKGIQERWHIEPIETWDKELKNPNKYIEAKGYTVKVKEMMPNYYAYMYKQLPSVIIGLIKEKMKVAKQYRLRIDPNVILIQTCLKIMEFDLGKYGTGDGIDGYLRKKTKFWLMEYKNRKGFSNKNADSMEDSYDKGIILSLINSVEAKETRGNIGITTEFS